MKTINVVAAIILDEEKRILATQRGYGELIFYETMMKLYEK